VTDVDAEGVDWTDVSESMVRQIVQQAETYLQSQFQAGLASDQRAMTIASVLVTVATAAAASALAYWDKTGSLPILAAGLAGATVMLVGAGLGAWAARPVDFYYPGNQPSSWYHCRRGDLVKALGGEAENYEQHIDYNEAILRNNNRAIAWSAKLAIAAPIVAVAVWAVSLCPFSRA
jgi:hypothetical protein